MTDIPMDKRKALGEGGGTKERKDEGMTEKLQFTEKERKNETERERERTNE